MVTTTLFNQNIWGVSKDRFNYLSFILNMLPKVWSKFASKATIRLRSYMTVFLLCFAFSSSIAQSLPPATSCTSNDLQVVGATLSNVDICSSCTVGTPLTGTLTLSINNTTGSNRTAFAFWGTLEITDGVTGQVTSTPIHGCNSTAIPPNSSALPPHAITSLTFDNINYKCGDILNITNLYLAWTDASPNSVCPLDPSTINPKCGTLPSIQINAGVNATSEITNVSCFGGNNGAIDITAFGGTGSFSYSWSASNGGNVPAGQVNNEDLTGLVAGTYQVTITDANNCQAVKVYTVTQPSGALSLATCSKTDATCSGNDGSVTAGTVSNAVGTVQYVWKNSSNTVVGNTASVSSLSAGTYYLTVSDDCSSQTCNVTVNAPSIPDAPTLSIVQPTCSDATATITVTSTTTGLLFSFDGGAYAAYPSGGYTTTTTGDHTVSVQNEAGCVSGNATETVNAQPSTPDAPTLSIVQPTCSNATATITVTSTTTGLLFSFDGGTYAAYPSEGFTTTTTGDHTVSVQNEAGCVSGNATETVNAQPSTPEAPTLSIVQPTCSDA
ncbi:MAG: SprB repeat-containing protein, partial [Ginsengibacter sp.]